MAQRYETFRGTVKELAATVDLNSRPLNQVLISNLVTYGLQAKVVGKSDRAAGQKGKSVTIVEVTSRSGQLFTRRPEAKAADASATDANVDASASNEVTG